MTASRDVSEMAWLGRKPSCNCPVYAALAVKKRSRPVVRLGRVKGKKWVDGSGVLDMECVPVERANVAICRCP